jgi:hypothetical protein
MDARGGAGADDTTLYARHRRYDGFEAVRHTQDVKAQMVSLVDARPQLEFGLFAGGAPPPRVVEEAVTAQVPGAELVHAMLGPETSLLAWGGAFIAGGVLCVAVGAGASSTVVGLPEGVVAIGTGVQLVATGLGLIFAAGLGNEWW